MSHDRYVVPPGNVMVELFDEEKTSAFGMILPSSDKDEYNMWVKVHKVGGNIIQQFITSLKFLYKKGDLVRIKKSVDRPIEIGDRKFLVVYEEDINLIKK